MVVKFGLERKKFLTALNRVVKVIPSSNASPILHYFLVESLNGCVKVSATDKAVTLTTTIEDVTTAGDAGKILIPAKQVIEALSRATQTYVVVSQSSELENTILVGCGNTKWQFKTRDVDNYPKESKFLESEIHTIQRMDLLTGLRSVRKAVAQDFKPSLTQVGIKEGKIAAADGVWFQESTLSSVEGLKFSIPKPVVDDLIIMMENNNSETMDIGFSEESDSMVFHVGVDKLTTHVMILPFPDISKSFLVPAMANKFVLKVGRKDLEDCVKRVRVTSDSKTMAIRFHLSDSSIMKVSSKTTSGSECTDSLPVEWFGGSREIVLHHEYLMNLLSSFEDDTLEFKLADDQKNKPSPLLVVSGGRSGVLNQLRADLV